MANGRTVAGMALWEPWADHSRERIRDRYAEVQMAIGKKRDSGRRQLGPKEFDEVATALCLLCRGSSMTRHPRMIPRSLSIIWRVISLRAAYKRLRSEPIRRT
jgi:hypothetical protein